MQQTATIRSINVLMCIGKVSGRFNRHRAALADPQLCPVLRLLPVRAVLIEFDIAAKLPFFTSSTVRSQGRQMDLRPVHVRYDPPQRCLVP